MNTKKLIPVLFLLATWLQSCGGDGGGGAVLPTRSEARILLGKESVPLFDSLVVLVSSSDMTSMHFLYSDLQEELKLTDLPPGTDRTFKVQVFADGGQMVQQGEVVSDLPSGEPVTLNIALQALAGFLRVEVPLGFDNSAGIVAGSMVLKSSGQPDKTYALQIVDGKGFFLTGALPLNTDFTLQIDLTDAGNGVLFNGTRSLRLASLLQNESLALKSTRGEANLILTLASGKPMQILASLPVAQLRIPVKEHEVLITELFPYPKTSGDDYEFMELYNTTLDTLDISGCSIGKTRTSSGATAALSMPTGTLLAPMSYWVLGRDSVSFAQYRYTSFVLSNSGQSLVLHCAGILLDSLTYALPSDLVNPFPLVAGASMQLPLRNWQSRALGASWCAGEDSVNVGGLPALGSPGKDALCAGI